MVHTFPCGSVTLLILPESEIGVFTAPFPNFKKYTYLSSTKKCFWERKTASPSPLGFIATIIFAVAGISPGRSKVSGFRPAFISCSFSFSFTTSFAYGVILGAGGFHPPYSPIIALFLLPSCLFFPVLHFPCILLQLLPELAPYFQSCQLFGLAAGKRE
ncbi:MAG TPA: hypothetical protein HA254_00840 [Candidatus Diapherotrites archaeon]|uniref:Uncharacterized protein n=1 Tax=Candidatus Iainarchaeum sp. TaxID=3101447 RepID=A0A7J4IY38_9ARCH|nr:hypothetical protein [Candidatus Diapherotrites archaeon]